MANVMITSIKRSRKKGWRYGSAVKNTYFYFPHNLYLGMWPFLIDGDLVEVDKNVLQQRHLPKRLPFVSE